MERIRLADLAEPDTVTGKPVFKERLAPQQGTKMRDYWFTAVQEEIANAIEGAGIALNPANFKQLLQAIKEPHAIRVNTTFTYGTDFTDLNTILRTLDRRFILPGVIVTLDLSPITTLQLTEPVLFKHPQGDQIHIVGSTTAPETKIIQYNRSVIPERRGLFEIQPGAQLGRLDGLTIREVNESNNRGRYLVRVYTNGKATLGDKLILSGVQGCCVRVDSGGWVDLKAATIQDANDDQVTRGANDTYKELKDLAGNGVLAVGHAQVYGLGTQFINCLSAGIRCIEGAQAVLWQCAFITAPCISHSGSIIRAKGCVGILCAANNAPWAFLASEMGQMDLEGCTAGVNGSANTYGFYADRMSKIMMRQCTAEYNDGAGIYAYNNSSISCEYGDASNCISRNNGGYGAIANRSSTIFGSLTFTGNTLGDSNITGYNAATLSAIVTSL